MLTRMRSFVRNSCGSPMKRLSPRSKLVAGLIAGVIAAYYLVPMLTPTPEIALTIGEPWEDMRQRSTARIGPSVPGRSWFGMPDTDASLRLVDSRYGFTTPPARFFAVGFTDDRVRNVRMSPQVEPLLLDDALKLVMDIEAQLVAGGWVNIRPDSQPRFADTPQWRAQLRDSKQGGTTYWQAGDSFQVFLVLHRFQYSKRPTEERYLLSLDLSAPRIPRDPTPYFPPQPKPCAAVCR
jgi:hypothetical protein